MSEATRHYRGKVAALTRARSPQDSELQEAQRTLRELRLAEYIRRTVDAAPPLTATQRDRLALLLSTGVADAS